MTEGGPSAAPPARRSVASVLGSSRGRVEAFVTAGAICAALSLIPLSPGPSG